MASVTKGPDSARWPTCPISGRRRASPPREPRASSSASRCPRAAAPLIASPRAEPRCVGDELAASAGANASSSAASVGGKRGAPISSRTAWAAREQSDGLEVVRPVPRLRQPQGDVLEHMGEGPPVVALGVGLERRAQVVGRLRRGAQVASGVAEVVVAHVATIHGSPTSSARVCGLLERPAPRPGRRGRWPACPCSSGTRSRLVRSPSARRRASASRADALGQRRGRPRPRRTSARFVSMAATPASSPSSRAHLEAGLVRRTGRRRGHPAGTPACPAGAAPGPSRTGPPMRGEPGFGARPAAAAASAYRPCLRCSSACADPVAVPPPAAVAHVGRPPPAHGRRRPRPGPSRRSISSASASCSRTPGRSSGSTSGSTCWRWSSAAATAYVARAASAAASR